LELLLLGCGARVLSGRKGGTCKDASRHKKHLNENA
jgi:hypothetical protein